MSSAEFREGGVRGFLDRPDAPLRDGIVLTHGAGGDCRMPLLVSVARAFVEAGVAVLRCDLPFRQKRLHGPPSPSTAAADRAGLKEALAALRGIVPGRLFLGGQSYGGRQASMLAAEVPGVAAGLLLLSYPLHPPGKPEQMRTAHFPMLGVPTLVVHGPRDPFATSDELRTAMAAIPGRVTLVEIEGAGHDLLGGKFDAARLVAEPFLGHVRTVAYEGPRG